MESLEPPAGSDTEERFRRALGRPDGDAAVARAGTVLRRFGADLHAAADPHSASNDVWLAGGFCLRMSRRAGPDSLFDEARLAAVLPPEVGYPEIIATGVEDGYQWMLTRRLPGLNLWEAWPAMTHDQRLAGIENLWQRHLALQQTDLDLLVGLNLPPRRYRFDRAAAAGQLRVLMEAGVVDDALAPSIWELVERGLDAIHAVPWRLVHGDPSFTNTQCHDGAVIGLLDLEAACVAPIDLDLDPLLCLLASPLDDPDPPGPHGMPDEDAFTGVFEQLVTVAQPLLQLPGASQRLRGYAALSTLTVVEGALGRGVPPDVLRGWTARVRDVIAHRSYLDRIWS